MNPRLDTFVPRDIEKVMHLPYTRYIICCSIYVYTYYTYNNTYIHIYIYILYIIIIIYIHIIYIYYVLRMRLACNSCKLKSTPLSLLDWWVEIVGELYLLEIRVDVLLRMNINIAINSNSLPSITITIYIYRACCKGR